MGLRAFNAGEERVRESVLYKYTYAVN